MSELIFNILLWLNFEYFILPYDRSTIFFDNAYQFYYIQQDPRDYHFKFFMIFYNNQSLFTFLFIYYQRLSYILPIDTMKQDAHIEEINCNFESLDSLRIQISPETKQSHHQVKTFCSPFHVGEFTQLLKLDNSSPEFLIEFSNSFRKIMEKQNQSQENEDFDVMGNRINQFDSKISMELEEEIYLSPIEEDKENQMPKSYLNTPLKLRRNDIRSPLQDITPSMTHRKKKTNNKLTTSGKMHLLTPRTMQKNGLTSSGLRF